MNGTIGMIYMAFLIFVFAFELSELISLHKKYKICNGADIFTIAIVISAIVYCIIRFIMIYIGLE